MDDFVLAGKEEFLQEITGVRYIKSDISKLEDRKFRLTGIFVKEEKDIIEVKMKFYAKSLKMIEIRDHVQPYRRM